MNTMLFDSGFDFVEPWFRTNNNRESFERELSREVMTTHPLFNMKVMAVAFRRDRDDVLFQIEGSDAKYAVVHLTYKRESDPKWPSTTLFKDRESVEQYLAADREEWLEDE
jgi:hypothetical protein